MKPVERVAGALLWFWRLVKGWLPQALATAATVFSIIWGGYGAEIWTKGQWALVVAIALAVLSRDRSGGVAAPVVHGTGEPERRGTGRVDCEV